jgi:site-specific recombinase XerD
MKLSKFVETFYASCRESKNSAGEMAQKTMAMNNHLLPFFGDMELGSIGPSDIRRYKNDKSADDLSAKTINNHLTVLSRCLSVAREEGVLKAPKWTVKLMKVDAMESRFLENAEIAKLVRAAEEEENIEWKQMIVIGLNTGMRISEMLALDWKDVNLNGSVRKINVCASVCRETGKLKKVKNGLARDVALNPMAAAVFKSMEHRDGPVFSMTYQGAYSAMKRIVDRAGLYDVGWHSLRHTFASALVTSGVPLLTVSRLLGHKSLKMTERYAHLSQEKNKDAVAVLATAMGF